ILDTDQLSKDKLVYQTYIYDKNSLEIKSKEVLFKELIDAYRHEKDIILNDIYVYLTHEETETNIPEKVFVLYETLNYEQLQVVKKDFMKEYGIDEKSSHRFLWRIDFLEKLIHWDEEDKELKDIVTYMSKLQASKLYAIALDMENRKGQDLYTPIPKLLSSFYKFMRKNEEIGLPLLKNMHDYSHPLHQSDISALIGLNPPKDAAKLLKFIKQANDDSKVYLIGSILRSYRPKS
ncbi:MAG: hypothetical protein RG740_02750, partial [Acholeplasmataceae bacterium]|nr:hypothetical protein [Acholeplasmataceae bacterium]